MASMGQLSSRQGRTGQGWEILQTLLWHPGHFLLQFKTHFVSNINDNKTKITLGMGGSYITMAPFSGHHRSPNGVMGTLMQTICQDHPTHRTSANHMRESWLVLETNVPHQCWRNLNLRGRMSLKNAVTYLQRARSFKQGTWELPWWYPIMAAFPSFRSYV